jgi:hypothetical protein
MCGRLWFVGGVIDVTWRSETMSLDAWLNAPPELMAAIGPTRCLPGTPGKVAMMTLRASYGMPLFHPDDAYIHEVIGGRNDLPDGRTIARVGLAYETK